MMLGGHGGFSPVAAVAQRDRIFLAQRNDAGTVSLAWANVDPDAVPEVPKWVASGPLAMHMPATAIDAEGRVVVACLAATGRLYVARQKSGADSLGEWTAVG
ncbi:hypothetical protein ABIA31_007791 [Catenulispora sp. MAP5-51]|uniref:hypothetical protein n=1 Tax=Catenulispora sp. MAP5-51 TaxID=3156298 RepID=UPI003514318C